MSRSRKLSRATVAAVAKVARATALREPGLAERIIASAEAHGLASEPDHEVGDLQDAVRALVEALPPAQRATFARAFWADREDWSGGGS